MPTRSPGYLYFYLICLLAMGIAIEGHAQEQKKDSLIALDEVVLSLERDPSSALSLVPVETLTEQAIRLQNPVDFAGTLNQVPGLYMLSGALNTNRITIRGVGARTPFGTDKLRMYFNDIPVTNGTGVSALEAYDLEDLYAIRVVKGPKAGAYGAALGGALLLESDRPIQDGTFLRSRTTTGSYGMFKTNLALEHQDGNLSAEVRYNKLTTQGYRENNAFDRDGVLVGITQSFSEDHQLSLLANYIDYRAEIPSSLNRTDFETEPTKAAFTWAAAKGYEANRYSLFGLANRMKLGKALENTTSLFATYLDHYEPRPFNILDETTFGYGLRTVFRLPLSPAGAKAEWGGELYRDRYQWSTYENRYEDNNGNGSLQGDQLSRNKEFRNQFFAFASLSWPVAPRLTARAGLSLNHTRYDYRDLFRTGTDNRSGKRDFDPVLLPSFDLRYEAPGGSSLYLNVSRGFSNPGLEETLTPDGLVNPEIGQEKGVNYEAGGQWLAVEGRLRVSGSLYRMEIRDLLVAERVGDDQFVGRNAGRTRHQGLELLAEYQWPIGRWNLAPYLSYSLSDHSFREFVDGDDDYSGNPLTGVPRHRVYGGVRLRSQGGIYWNTTYQYVDPIPLRDDASVYSDPYQLLSMQWGYRRALTGKLTAEFQLGINNLANTNYASSVLINAGSFGGAQPRYFYPGNNRNYYTGLLLLWAL